MVTPGKIPLPATFPEDGTQYVTSFGEDWLPVIIGALDNLRLSGEWEGQPEDIDLLLDTLTNQIMTPATAGGAMPTTAFFVHGQAITQASMPTEFEGFLGVDDFGSLPFLGGAFYQSVNAQGDTFSLTLQLDAGNYLLYGFAVRDNLSGILEWSVDGTAIDVPDDLYFLGTFFNFPFQHPFSLLSAGDHTLTGTVIDKNAASDGYQAQLFAYWVIPFDIP